MAYPQNDHGQLWERGHLLLCLLFSVCFVLQVSCDHSHAMGPPVWWERAADTTVSRLSLLGQPLSRAKAAETNLYYEDALGCTFQYTPPVEGILWVEYYPEKERISTLALLWESDNFSQMTEIYQQLRKAYTHKYGMPRGTIGDLEWFVSDTLKVTLRLSPERRYLHGSFSLLRKSG